ncbi:MAG: TetR/AcrR family transcriptional regulator [Nitrospinae bacterium]|nr:TetR/AcrR family transcriptional regulator [Nitrospinota bacterium]
MAKRETGEIRRQQILESAIRCISRQGYHQTTMDDIASEAGLSKGALYWYFKSKDEILTAMCRQQCDEHLQILSHFADQNMSIKELALKTGDKILESLINEPEQCKMSFEFWALTDENEQVKRSQYEVHKIWQETVSNLIKSGIKKGEIKPDVNVKELSIALLAIFDGIIIAYSIDKTLNVKKIWHTAISAFFEGIAK